MRSSPGDQKVKNRYGKCRSGHRTRGERDSSSLWCRDTDTERSHSTLCFVHETRPGSRMLRGWLPNARPSGLQKRSPRPPRARSGRRLGQQVAGGRLHSGAGLQSLTRWAARRVQGGSGAALSLPFSSPPAGLRSRLSCRLGSSVSSGNTTPPQV